MQQAGDQVATALEALVATALSNSPPNPAHAAVLTVIDENHRRRTDEAIVAGYERIPQAEHDPGWSDGVTRRMIADDPW